MRADARAVVDAADASEDRSWPWPGRRGLQRRLPRCLGGGGGGAADVRRRSRGRTRRPIASPSCSPGSRCGWRLQGRVAETGALHRGGQGSPIRPTATHPGRTGRDRALDRRRFRRHDRTRARGRRVAADGDAEAASDRDNDGRAGRDRTRRRGRGRASGGACGVYGGRDWWILPADDARCGSGTRMARGSPPPRVRGGPCAGGGEDVGDYSPAVGRVRAVRPG